MIERIKNAISLFLDSAFSIILCAIVIGALSSIPMYLFLTTCPCE